MEKPKDKKTAKVCYSHIGGKLGALLLEQFAQKGWLKKAEVSDKHFLITAKGEKEFMKLGIDLSKIE